MARGGAPGGGSIWNGSSFTAVDKPELCDGFFQGHFPSSKKTSGKRMFAHKQQLKDQKGKSKIVVVGGTDGTLEILLILQFWRSESWNADSAWKSAIANKYLERVAINYSYYRILRDHDAAFVDIAHHHAGPSLALPPP